MVGLREMMLVDVYEASDAVKVLYRLLEERSTENDPHINISHRKLPSWAQHNEFFFSRPFVVWYLIDVDGDWVGYISVTRRNEIGVFLFRAFRGKGYGTAAVKMLIEKVEPMPTIASERVGRFLANINPKNKASIAMFKKLGFHHIQNTYEFDA